MRLTNQEIIGSKGFYRDNFRKLKTVLAISLLLNALLTMLCFYFKMTEAEPMYYASNPFGIIKLQAYETANVNDQPLLAPDPPEEAGEKRLSLD